MVIDKPLCDGNAWEFQMIDDGGSNTNYTVSGRVKTGHEGAGKTGQ